MALTTWVVLLRGINAGGHGKLLTKDLIATLQELGFSEIHTYLQTGNAIFRSDEKRGRVLAERIAEAIQAGQGFKPHAMAFSVRSFRAAAAASPFRISEAESRTVHLYFLSEAATRPDRSLLDRMKTGREEYHLGKRVLYLHTPDGFAPSKLARSVERALGVPATARNWRSVGKILEIAERVQRR